MTDAAFAVEEAKVVWAQVGLRRSVEQAPQAGVFG